MHVVLLEREIFEVIQESNMSANNITSNQDEERYSMDVNNANRKYYL